MGVKEPERELPTVDHRILESKGGVVSKAPGSVGSGASRGLRDQAYEITTLLDLWASEEG